MFRLVFGLLVFSCSAAMIWNDDEQNPDALSLLQTQAVSMNPRHGRHAIQGAHQRSAADVSATHTREKPKFNSSIGAKMMSRINQSQGEGKLKQSTKGSAPGGTHGPGPYTMFAHRVNGVAAMGKVDEHTRGIEIDVAWAHGEWYACHGDMHCEFIWDKERLVEILAYTPSFVNALWLDIKQGSNGVGFQDDQEQLTESNFWALAEVLYEIPRIAAGDINLLFGNGAHTDTKENWEIADFMAKVVHEYGMKKYWYLDFPVYENEDAALKKVSDKCVAADVKCTVSAGVSLIGQHPIDKLSHYTEILARAKKFDNIMKTNLWTLPAAIPTSDVQFVDDLIRLGANGRNYWEYLAGWDWACGAFIDGYIVGPFFMEWIGCGDGCREIADVHTDVGREPATLADWYVKYKDHSSACDSGCVY